MVPSSLSVWLQHAGHTRRSPDINAEAILLIQPTVFQEKGKTTRTKDDPIVYVKEIEDGLRLWVAAPPD